jgi:hypothetical protein
MLNVLSNTQQIQSYKTLREEILFFLSTTSQPDAVLLLSNTKTVTREALVATMNLIVKHTTEMPVKRTVDMTETKIMVVQKLSKGDLNPVIGMTDDWYTKLRRQILNDTLDYLFTY